MVCFSVQSLEARLEHTVLDAQENKDRIQVMQDHLHNVKRELGFTQSRVAEKKKEIETETHIKTLTDVVSVRIFLSLDCERLHPS